MTDSTNAMTMKRIHREMSDIKKEDLGAITLAPSEDNMFLWKGSIPGPDGSCYDGGVFNLEIVLAPDYPFSAPKVTFTTRIYHMNISERGNICIDILKHNWSPALSLYKVMLSLSSLLTDPNPLDPLVPNIASEYTRHRAQHDKTAREWTTLYAHPPAPRVATPAQSSKSKSKGKAKASAALVISDDEAGPSSGSRPVPVARKSKSQKRKQVSESETLEISDEDTEELHRTAQAKKRARTSKTTKQLGEVIVIDD